MALSGTIQLSLSIWGWEAIWSIVRRMIRCPPSGNYELISRITPVSRAYRGGLDTFTSPNSTDLMTPPMVGALGPSPLDEAFTLEIFRTLVRSGHGCVGVLTPMTTCFLQQESILKASVDLGGASYELDFYGYPGGFTEDKLLVGYAAALSRRSKPVAPIHLPVHHAIGTGSRSTMTQYRYNVA